MSVVVAYEEVGPCRRKLTFQVPAEAVTAEIGRVIGDYRRELKLPGFRKGKVPSNLVRQRFRQDIEREVAQRLVPRYWHQAQAEKNLDPLLPPEFEEPQVQEGEPMTVVASVETRPEIALQDYRSFDLPSASIDPTDDEVDAALTDLRRQLASWKTVERPAARGDLVVARVRDKDPTGDEGPDERPIHVELGAEGIDEELTLALTGLAAGQSTDFNRKVEPEDEAGGEEVAGETAAPETTAPETTAGEKKERRFAITVDEVKEQDLPELDDAFAKEVGDFAGVDELRRAVSDRLRHGKQHELTHRREEALLEQLRTRHPLELPKKVVERESEELVHRHLDRLVQQGIQIDPAHLDWQRLLEGARPQAERRVHDRLLLDAVAGAEGLRLDEKEFERFLMSVASQQKSSTLALRQQLNENGRLEPLRAQLLREQTLRHLLGEEAREDSEPAAQAAPQEG